MLRQTHHGNAGNIHQRAQLGAVIQRGNEPPGKKATGATSTCVMHSIMPNKALLVRSSPTSCTMRDTPSARVKTAFCAKMASSA